MIYLGSFIDFEKLLTHVIEEYIAGLNIIDFKYVRSVENVEDVETFTFLRGRAYTKSGFELMHDESTYIASENTVLFIFGCAEPCNGEAGNYGEGDQSIGVRFNLATEQILIQRDI